jgi:hypothetical protein
MATDRFAVMARSEKPIHPQAYSTSPSTAVWPTFLTDDPFIFALGVRPTDKRHSQGKEAPINHMKSIFDPQDAPCLCGDIDTKLSSQYLKRTRP